MGHFWNNIGPHMGYHCGAQLGFADDFGMGGMDLNMGLIQDLSGKTWAPRGSPFWDPSGFSKLLWYGSLMGLDMGPTWDLSVETWVPYGLTLWDPYYFANDFGMGHTWVHIWDPHGTYFGPNRFQTGYHYGPI